MSEEAEYILYHIFSGRVFFHFLRLSYVALMLCVTAMLHLKPLYTPLLLRDWSGAAPGSRLYGFSRRSGVTAIFFFFIPARYPV
ncbi:hypothetical protein, partial [Enterobacter intestinihominis]